MYITMYFPAGLKQTFKLGMLELESVCNQHVLVTKKERSAVAIKRRPRSGNGHFTRD